MRYTSPNGRTTQRLPFFIPTTRYNNSIQQLDTTNDLLTFRAGLIALAELMASLSLSERIGKHFPLPKSNRGYLPSEMLKTFIFLQHERSFYLDDVRHIKDDAGY